MVNQQDLAERSAAAMWDGDVASKGLGMRLLDVGPGTARVGMVVRADMINGWQLCHGGLIATATERAIRGRSGVYDVTVVRSSDGATIAEFRGRSRSLGRPNPATDKD